MTTRKKECTHYVDYFGAPASLSACSSYAQVKFPKTLPNKVVLWFKNFLRAAKHAHRFVRLKNFETIIAAWDTILATYRLHNRQWKNINLREISFKSTERGEGCILWETKCCSWLLVGRCFSKSWQIQNHWCSWIGKKSRGLVFC